MTVTLEDVRRALVRPPVPQVAPREAAVAAILTPGLDLLFVKRAEFEGDPWSGHVAFPGGSVEPGDEGSLGAAVRETWEEIGLDLREADVLGELDHVAPISGLKPIAVHPFVFAVDHLPALRPNAEVASVHRVGLARLLADEGRGPMPYRYRGAEVVLPRVDFDGVRLWGLTLRIVDDLLDRIDGRGIGLDRLR